MPDLRPPSSLCDSCIYCQTIESAKGSVFQLCRKGLQDPRFPKYPHLPVRFCPGFVRLRPAAPEDFAAIQRIYEHWVLTGTSTFEIEPPGEAELQQRWQAIVSHNLPYLVAQDEDGVIAGYAYAALYRPRPAYRFTVEDSIYLHPGAARKGIGRALLSALIADSARLGYRQMVAIVGGGLENQPSVGLHLKCGFTHAGLLRNVGFKFDRWLDTAILQRPLP